MRVGGFGDQHKGNAGGRQHVHSLGRAGIAFGNDQPGIKRQHVFWRKGADIADIRQGQHAFRPVRRAVAGDKPVFRAKGHRDFGDRPTKGHKTRAVICHGGGGKAK